jgi:predicted enzyme related to lactoylglutathione lyase
MSAFPNRPVVHLELHTGDLAAARAFYAGLCGWAPDDVSTPAGPYVSLQLGRRPISGGFVECEIPRPLWLPYVEVGDVARATERAHALGATVTLEPREGPAGWRSVVASRTGGEIAFWQPKP